MASIQPYQTAKGTRYQVRYRNPDGTQTMKRGFRTKRDARAWAEDTETNKRRGEHIKPTAGRATVAEVGQAWLDAKRLHKPATYHALESSWRVHVKPRWGNHPVADVHASDIQDWVTELAATRSATTVIRCHGILAGTLDRAVKDRRIARNPARDGIDLPRKTPKPRVYLTHAQVEALAVEAGGHASLVRLMAYTGLRWGEAIALRVKHLDTPRRTIHIEENAVQVGSRIHVGAPKTWERRSVRFPASLAGDLAAACAGKRRDDLVFSRDDGTHLFRPLSVRGWFVGAAGRAGLPRLTPHDLRHTAASLAVSSGANAKAVQRMLGHKSAAMTLDTYADLFDHDLDDVADRLDAARARALDAA